MTTAISKFPRLVQSSKKLELYDGRIIVTYDAETFDLLTIEDWNGNEPADPIWDDIANERLAAMKEESL